MISLSELLDAIIALISNIPVIIHSYSKWKIELAHRCCHSYPIYEYARKIGSRKEGNGTVLDNMPPDHRHAGDFKARIH